MKLHFEREEEFKLECWQKRAVNKGLYAAVILETGFAISIRNHQFLCITEKIFCYSCEQDFFSKY